MSLTSGIVLISVLGLVSVTDVRDRVIPNGVLLAAVGLWLALSVLTGGEEAVVQFVAAIVIAAPLLIASLVRPDGMGMGDVKLVAVIGLYLGWGAWVALLAGLFLAGLTGVLISLGNRRPPGETTLPLAPFLAAGVIISLIPLQ